MSKLVLMLLISFTAAASQAGYNWSFSNDDEIRCYPADAYGRVNAGYDPVDDIMCLLDGRVEWDVSGEDAYYIYYSCFPKRPSWISSWEATWFFDTAVDNSFCGH